MLDGVPVPEPVASESDASSGLAVGIRRVVAHDDGCLLVRRPAFDMVGGFIGDEAAGPAGAAGLAGVELSLLLNLAGCAVVHDGRAALWDRRPADADPAARAAAARDHLIGRWAPRLYRAVLRDLVAGGTTWRREPLRIALAGRIATADGSALGCNSAAGRSTTSPRAGRRPVPATCS